MNIDLSPEQAAFIRSLSDFDLTMILSEINDHGWQPAKGTLALAAAAIACRGQATAPALAAAVYLAWLQTAEEHRSRH